MWERDPALPEVVARAWNVNLPAGDLGSVAGSLKELMKNLKVWNKEKFGNVLKEIEKLRAELDAIQQSSIDRSILSRSVPLAQHFF